MTNMYRKLLDYRGYMLRVLVACDYGRLEGYYCLFVKFEKASYIW